MQFSTVGLCFDDYETLATVNLTSTDDVPVRRVGPLAYRQPPRGEGPALIRGQKCAGLSEPRLVA